MKILFVATPSALPSFDGTVSALAARGHRVRIASAGGIEPSALPASWQRDQRISVGPCPDQRGDDWQDPIRLLRALRDYAGGAGASEGAAHPARGARVRDVVASLGGQRTGTSARCPSCASVMADDDLGALAAAAGPVAMHNLSELLRLAEDAVPSDARYEAFLRAEQPDVVLVTPAAGVSWQADVVKSARALRLPLGLAASGPEETTIDAAVAAQVDRIFVWNDSQKDAIGRSHLLTAERIVDVGLPSQQATAPRLADAIERLRAPKRSVMPRWWRSARSDRGE